MNTTCQPTKDEFDALLNWFAPDKQEAAESYERIRLGLARFFRFRGCSDPDLLADETLNRVAQKLRGLDLTRNVKKISIFYGFAHNIYREYLNRVAKKEIQLNLERPIRSNDHDLSGEPENDFQDGAFNCLERCMKELPQDERNLLVRYYSEEKAQKIELRKRLAEELKTRANTLHVRVHRHRKVLRKCVERCLSENSL